ncbi:MAG: type II secretion system GspH family protein [Puniceicoccales bacterium]|jgi:type II secretory pathway pseudopilin PulG|nr:type II secretion system GspH family protein [Puniceicoccales bacterium]
MKRGFSLLEIVLAVGILGFSLPILLTHMAESTGKTEKRIQEMLLTNTAKNVQNVLSVFPKAPELDTSNQAYCGYRNGIFVIADTASGFDGAIFVLERKEVEAGANESVTETIYELYPWDSKNQVPRLTLPHVEIKQSVVANSLGISV